MPPELAVGIGKRLLKIRKSLGLSQEKIAELFDVSRTYYGKIERGEASPSLMQLINLQNLHRFDLHHLITGEKWSDSTSKRKAEMSTEERFDQQDRMLHHIIDLLQKEK